MMTKLVEKVTNLVKEEYELASAVHGAKHNSPHEAYGVILEELQEASYEDVNTRRMFQNFWDEVKVNAKTEDLITISENMRNSAILCACEMIQVAAMAHKAMQGFVIDEPIVPYEPMFNIGVDSSDSDDMTADIADIIKEKGGAKE